MQKLPIVAATVLVAALTVDLTAQFRRRGGDRTKVWELLAKNHDKNGDGKITSAEYNRGNAKFAAYDSDGDGVLTKADFEAGGRRGRNRRGGRRNMANMAGRVLGPIMQKHVDPKGTGKVAHAAWQKWVLGLDKDQDGVVVQDEFPAIGQRGGGQQRRQRRGTFRLSFRQMQRMLDSDRDGDLQVGELVAAFAHVDKDKDKVATTAEMTAGQPVRLPQKGDWAPDFDLPTIKQKADQVLTQKTFKLSSFRGKKPVALVFGSYT